MSEILDVGELKGKLSTFAKERDWEQFHTPKNLSMGLSVEAAELVEIFQWLSDAESVKIMEDSKKCMQVRDEIADIMVYAVRICGVLGIDVPKEIERKLKLNAEKYPIEKCKGNARKYCDL